MSPQRSSYLSVSMNLSMILNSMSEASSNPELGSSNSLSLFYCSGVKVRSVFLWLEAWSASACSSVPS